MSEKANNSEVNQEQSMTFDIKRIYIKDVSFESPVSPDVFNNEWKPEIQMDMNFSSNKLTVADHYEVTLRITLTAKLDGKVAFLCEVIQAGVFEIKGLAKEQLSHCLGAYCPNILFPYARECISSLINRGTFQPINLMPVNFDALFMQYLEQQNSVATDSSTSTPEEPIQAH